MNLFSIKNNNKKSGFTLVETLVAISIFTLSVLAVMVITSKGISDTSYVKKKIVATYLAEEGIEYVRNMRDTYMLYSATAQTGWNNFVAKLTAASCHIANGCYFDERNVSYVDDSMPMTDLAFTACGSSPCPSGELRYESSTGKYNYVSGTFSGLIRKIKITQISADEYKIASTVSWTQASGTYNITFYENLYNWIE